MPSPSINLSELDGTNGFVIQNSNDEFNEFPYSYFSVKSAEDINGDGFTDLIVQSLGLTEAYSYDETRPSYVVFGGPNVGASSSLDLSTLDGSNGFRLDGLIQTFYSTTSDINGDGMADLIMGVPYADPNGILDAGSTYVVFGSTNIGATGILEASSLDGSNGFVINGINEGNLLGVSITSGNDINGDGMADLIIGAPAADPNGIFDAGSTYVVFGGTNVGAEGNVDPSSLDGSNGFVINGINEGDRLGRTVISTSDINADGMADLIIGAPNADPNGILDAGSTYVVFGGTNLGAGGSIDLSSLDGSNGFVINGINYSDILGGSVISTSDINADGMADVIIGAPNADPNGISNAGSTYVVFGGTTVGAGGIVEASSLDGSNGFVINGINEYNFLGWPVISDSDINADGIADLIISAPFAEPNGIFGAGSTYVVFGGTTTGATGSIDLSSLDGSNGFVINGINEYGYLGNSGISVSDINADGIADLILGASLADPNGITDAGSTYVVFGGTTTGATGSIDLSSLDGNNGFVLNGIAVNDLSGSLLSGAGDVNGDGIDDVIINAPGSNSSYVVFGSAVSPSDPTPEDPAVNPTAVNDTRFTTLNTPLTLNVIANDTDANGNPLQISSFDTISTKGGSITLNDNGTVDDLSDDLLVYTPASDLLGFDSFSYTIDNGIGGTATATVNLAVFSQVGTFGNDTLTEGSCPQPEEKKELLAEKVKTRVIGNTDLVANLGTGTGSTVSS
jgi:hypothetical protein